MLNHSNFKSDL